MRVITRSYRREREGVGTNTNNDDITRGCRGYNAGTRDYDSITRSYRRWGKVIGDNEKL